MGMAYLFMLIIYSTVAIVVYKLIKLQTNNVWIKRGVVTYNLLTCKDKYQTKGGNMLKWRKKEIEIVLQVKIKEEGKR